MSEKQQNTENSSVSICETSIEASKQILCKLSEMDVLVDKASEIWGGEENRILKMAFSEFSETIEDVLHRLTNQKAETEDKESLDGKIVLL